MARIATEVVSYEDTGDGSRVDVKVDSLSAVPDEFQEIRARARALTATGFASSATGVLEDVELGEVERLTQTLEVKMVNSGNVRETKVFTVMVDTPF